MSGTKGSGRGVPTPPATLSCNLAVLPKGTVLHRIHDHEFKGNAFNPGYGKSRFAPFTAASVAIPTSYAGTTLECALFESIFHDINPKKPYKSVRSSKIAHLDYSVLELTRDLKLAKLFTPDLMKWNLTRAQLIDTTKAHYYAKRRAWSEPIHESKEQPEGMIWTSRAFDEQQAMMLFGSRIAPADLTVLSTVKVARDAACVRTLHEEATRSGIVIIR